MKKWIALLLSALLAVTVLVGCGCEHEWKDATCDAPKTCEICGQTEGAPNGHSWQAATCDAPKTCEICGKTEGSALGHDWVDADCETAKTCSRCGLAEGEALGHTWVDATTELPKTCSTCGKTEGEKIQVDSRFSTAACEALFGTWSCQMAMDGEAILGVSVPGEDLDFVACITCTFTNDGKLMMDITYDEESYLHAVELYTIELMYDTLMSQGMTRDQADEAMLATYGMNVTDYVKASVSMIDVDDYAQTLEFVYYVSDGSIYAADDWDEEMTPEAYTLEGDKLSINSSGMELELTRQP
ncbi:MAG: hypothetical protein ACI4PO_08550 [Faecousia sp.]